MKRLRLMLLLILLCGAAVAVWLLRSVAGQARLERWLQAHLPETIHVEGLSGPLPFRGELRVVELRDTHGVWFAAHRVRWAMRPRTLLSGAIIVDEVAGQSVRIARWPVGDEADDRAHEAASTHPTIWIQRALAENVELPIAIQGDAIPFRASGAFKMESNTWSAAASARAMWRGESLLAIGSARRSETGSSFELRRLQGTGIEVRGAGSWRPNARMELHGAYTNAPLLTELLGIDKAGSGAVSGRIEWDQQVKGSFAVDVRDGDGFGLTLTHATGLIDVVGSELIARIGEGEGVWRDQPWHIEQPVEIVSQAGQIQWQAPALRWAGQLVSSSGTVSQADIDASVKIPAIELAPSPLSNRFSAGRVLAAASVAGPRANPVWQFRVEGADLVPRIESAFQLHPVRLLVNGVASSGVVNLNVALSGLTKDAITATAQLPIRLPLDGSPIGPDPEGALTATLAFGANLDEAGSFADLRGAEIEGRLDGKMELHGTWSHPLVRGVIAMENAHAEFPESGTVLRNIRVRLEGDQDQLVVREATADDGEGGQLALSGAFAFDPTKGFPLTANLALHRVALWRRADTRTRFDGTLGVAGPLSGLAVTGSVKLVDAEVLLRPSAPDIPTLPLAETHASEPVIVSTQTWLNTVSLNVAVRGRDIHVAGRGLESTWRADMNVVGRASAPSLRGALSIERGYFLFMGRRFLLDQARLSFDGRWPPAPLVDITASSRVSDMTAWLYATGPLDAPALTMQSDPAYPSDEILARLLFGRSTDTISPFQAIRLAHGLNVLRGRGRTVDVLERGQSALRVDQLELVQSDTDQGISAISVGKYVGRNVYVEGEKGLGDAADTISVEVDLTRSLILTTESSPRIREGIGLKWRRDY